MSDRPFDPRKLGSGTVSFAELRKELAPLIEELLARVPDEQREVAAKAVADYLDAAEAAASKPDLRGTTIFSAAAIRDLIRIARRENQEDET